MKLSNNDFLEKFKTTALVILTLVAVFLSYLNFGLIDHSKENEYQIESFDGNIFDYVCPSDFYYGLGGISYTKVVDVEKTQEIWRQLIPSISKALSHFNQWTEIERDSYYSKLKNGTLLMIMPEYLTIDMFLNTADSKSNNVKKLGSEVLDLHIHEFMFMDSDLYVKLGDAFYYSTLEDPLKKEEIDGLIVTNSNSTYRRIVDRFSLRSVFPENPARYNYKLIPYQFDSMINEYTSMSEFDHISLYDEKVNDISLEIFEDNMDFVKSSYDSKNSLVLMYGLGEKTLTFERTGRLLYKSKFDIKDKRKLTFKDSLALGLSYIKKTGGIPEGLFLDKWETAEDKINMHFSYRQGPYLVCGPEQRGISIEIRGGQVIKAERYIALMDQVELSVDKIHTLDECINNSIHRIENEYKRKGLENLIDERFHFLIRSDIRSTSMVYYHHENLLKPCWKININGDVYVFEIYSGNYLGGGYELEAN